MGVTGTRNLLLEALKKGTWSLASLAQSSQKPLIAAPPVIRSQELGVKANRSL